MEIVETKPDLIRKDDNLIAITHLSQLLDYVTGGIGGTIAPIVLWIVNKDRVAGMDEHGKSIVNFRLSLLIYTLLSIPAIFLFGLGLITLVLIMLLSVILPIVNAVNVGNGLKPNYYISIPFIS